MKRSDCQSSLAEQRLRTRLDAALRRVYGLRDFEAALSEERAVMMREVRDQLTERIKTRFDWHAGGNE